MEGYKFCFLLILQLVSVSGEDLPFLSKENAFAVLHREKRSMKSECLGGCSYSEVRKIVGGVSSKVCEAMREFRCENNHCSSNHYCKTISADCSNSNNYRAVCKLCESEKDIEHCVKKKSLKLTCNEIARCETCEKGYYLAENGSQCIMCESEYQIEHCIKYVNLTCNEKARCETCEDGYYSYGSKCTTSVYEDFRGIYQRSQENIFKYLYFEFD